MADPSLHPDEPPAAESLDENKEEVEPAELQLPVPYFPVLGDIVEVSYPGANVHGCIGRVIEVKRDDPNFIRVHVGLKLYLPLRNLLNVRPRGGQYGRIFGSLHRGNLVFVVSEREESCSGRFVQGHSPA